MDSDATRLTLTAVEQRVLGALLEKERTVPVSYPMTLNGLRTACNQTSGRDPIVSLAEAEVTAVLDDLKARGLIRMVHASHGARVVKYRQVLDERLELDGGERAVLTLLLLRGAQTPGELHSRAERLHTFGDLSAVERGLAGLAARPEPLARELDRRPGQKENRWCHLLGPAASADDDRLGAGPTVVESDAGAAAGSTDRRVVGDANSAVTESVLLGGPVARDASVVAGYDEVAADYAEHLVDELDAKPLDRWLLERVVELADGGPVADAGCGPGHVALHLAAAGGDVTGFDLSPAMVAEARRRFGELTFLVGDLTALPPPPERPGGEADAQDASDRPDGSHLPGDSYEGGWAAVVAWYSLVHLAGSELPPAVALMAGALRPGGWLALAVHVGPEVRRFTEWWGHPVDLTFALHDPLQVLDAVATAGLEDVEWYRRGPYAGVEVETERLYVLARRPA
ncbi:MAG: DUF480 domain-containing protein [Acidimicrobiia bacterium]|nr:DUF480 domain-containing protein [Acidimicrobiia bacterium]